GGPAREAVARLQGDREPLAELVGGAEPQVAAQGLSGIRRTEVPRERQTGRPPLRDVEAGIEAERGGPRGVEGRLARQAGQPAARADREVQRLRRRNSRAHVEADARRTAAEAALRAAGRQREGEGGREIRREGAGQL